MWTLVVTCMCIRLCFFLFVLCMCIFKNKFIHVACVYACISACKRKCSYLYFVYNYLFFLHLVCVYMYALMYVYAPIECLYVCVFTHENEDDHRVNNGKWDKKKENKKENRRKSHVAIWTNVSHLKLKQMRQRKQN